MEVIMTVIGVSALIVIVSVAAYFLSQEEVYEQPTTRTPVPENLPQISQRHNVTVNTTDDVEPQKKKYVYSRNSCVLSPPSSDPIIDGLTFGALLDTFDDNKPVEVHTTTHYEAPVETPQILQAEAPDQTADRGFDYSASHSHSDYSSSYSDPSPSYDGGSSYDSGGSSDRGSCDCGSGD